MWQSSRYGDVYDLRRFQADQHWFGIRTTRETKGDGLWVRGYPYNFDKGNRIFYALELKSQGD